MAGSLQQELDVALRLARQAGDRIMHYYGTDLAVDYKAGDEPVTAADRAADDLIVAGLRAAFPRDGLITEESEDDLSRLDEERVWIVDPLDGTGEFIAATGDFVVQIALTLTGRPVLGVIYQPTQGQLLYSVHGLGAFQLLDGRPARLRVSTESDPASMCLVASRTHYTPFVESARRVLGIQQVTQLGSVGLKVGLVAAGACDLYLASTVSKEWDFCAPHALLRAAGGVLTDLCGEPLVYNLAEVAECPGLIGSNGQAHGQIVQALAPLLESQEP